MNLLRLRVGDAAHDDALTTVREFFEALGHDARNRARTYVAPESTWFGESFDWDTDLFRRISLRLASIRPVAHATLGILPPDLLDHLISAEPDDTVVFCDLICDDQQPVTAIVAVAPSGKIRSVRDPGDFVEFVNAWAATTPPSAVRV